MKRVFYIIITIAVFASCKDKIGPEDCFMAAGKDATHEVVPGNFTAIDIGDRFKIELLQDTAQNPKVVLKGGKNVINNISVGVSNGVLTVKDRNVCNWTRDFNKKITLQITCKQLHGITIKDACEISYSDTLFTDSLVIFQRSTGTLNLAFNAGKLEVNHEGLGQINLSGYAAVFVPVMFDGGKLMAQHLQGDYTFAYHYGINQLHVKPYKALFVLVGNKGITYYYQEPIETPLQVTRVGEGKVEKR